MMVGCDISQENYQFNILRVDRNDDQTTIKTTWQAGLMKNCTEPGEEKIVHLIREMSSWFFLIEAIVEFPDDLFTQSQRRHVRLK